MTTNIPPEIADEKIAAWVTKITKARHDNDSTRFDEQVLTGCDLMRRPAPAPVRISPEVRETILACLANSVDVVACRADVVAAIAFVEAL